MFLNNSQYRHKIANGTIGIVTDIEKLGVHFVSKNAIVDMVVKKYTSSVIINGTPTIRIQFPLINEFALTTHKIQASTLPDISVDLNAQMFEKGQSYTAISRCKSWDNVKIKSLHLLLISQ
jgi:ATP-dependent exoDNAse (exonuclease V) alpha subunit